MHIFKKLCSLPQGYSEELNTGIIPKVEATCRNSLFLNSELLSDKILGDLPNLECTLAK